MAENNSSSFIRQVAYKIPIKEIHRGDFIKENEDTPNYLLTSDEKKIYRLNLIGIIINKELVGSITNLFIEDGTGNIIVRSFEENKYVETINVGEIILVIGKVRVFNDQKYISPEIIKKTTANWLKLRSIELKEYQKEIIINSPSKIVKENEKPKISISNSKTEEIKKEIPKIPSEEHLIETNSILNNELFDEEIVEDVALPFQKINSLIKELDKGEGVLIEEILEKYNIENTENIIKIMLQNGEIFQIQPGKVKVL